MGLSQALLPEFDYEMANTRKTLERVPDDKFGYKPHEKSFAMGALATHISHLPSWADMTIKTESLDIAPPGEPPMTLPEAHTNKELLEMFDKNVGEARAAIAAVSDGDLMKPWTLLNGGSEILTQPRIAVLRGFVMNHIIHHRAQLTVYLRLNDIPVPSLYGPSADEGGF
ncbi:MAG: DinB family protein [Blastocatellia bacterium]